LNIKQNSNTGFLILFWHSHPSKWSYSRSWNRCKRGWLPRPCWSRCMNCDALQAFSRTSGVYGFFLYISLNFRWPPFIQFETYKKRSSPYHCLSFGLCAFVAHYPWWSEEPSGIFTWEQTRWFTVNLSRHIDVRNRSHYIHWMKELFSAAIFLTTWGSGIVLITLGLGIVLMTFIGLKRIGVRNRSHHIGCWNRTHHVSRSC
jgi:hypothetical protein